MYTRCVCVCVCVHTHYVHTMYVRTNVHTHTHSLSHTQTHTYIVSGQDRGEDAVSRRGAQRCRHHAVCVCVCVCVRVRVRVRMCVDLENVFRDKAQAFRGCHEHVGLPILHR